MLACAKAKPCADTRFRAAVLGWDIVQTQIPAVPFVKKYENVFALKYAPPSLLSPRPRNRS